VRDRETTLQAFGEFLLRARLVFHKAAPHCVRWVRRFFERPAENLSVAEQVRSFCEALEREGRWQDWQIQQASHALRIYFVNFLKQTNWDRQPPRSVADESGHINVPAALDQMRLRIRTRHYSYQTELSYLDWVRRFLAYAAERQEAEHPKVGRGARPRLPDPPGGPPTRLSQHAEPGRMRASVPLP
jgi:hypothetical protein